MLKIKAHGLIHKFDFTLFNFEFESNTMKHSCTKIKILLCFCTFLMAAFFSGAKDAFAFRVTPMVHDLSPAGNGSTVTLRIENTTGDRLPVELYAQARTIKKDGSADLSPADNDFLIFPPQVVVEPNTIQSVRVQYIGNPDIETSKGYVVNVAQLPVGFDAEDQSGVQFTFNFGVSLNVVPPGAEPDVSVSGSRVINGEVEVEVVNTGAAYTRLNNGRWIYRYGGSEHVLEDEALREAIGQPLIQPQTTRVIRLPLPPGYGKGQEINVAYRAD